MKKSTEIQVFTKEVNKIANTSYKQIIASFLLSGLSGLVQYESFSLQFQSFSVLMGGIVGSSAIITSFISAPQSPSALFQDFKPKRISKIVLLNFGFAFISFGFFYFLVTKGSQWCLIFMLAGIFMFFKALSLSAISLRLRAKMQELNPEQRKILYNQELQRLKEKDKLDRQNENLIISTEKAIREAEKFAKDIQHKNKQQKQKLRREKINKILKWPLTATIEMRRKLGFLTINEKKQDDENEKQFFNWLYYDDARAILNGEGKIIEHEKSGINLHKFDSKYFFLVDGKMHLDQSKELFEKLGDMVGEIVVLIKSEADLTVEANQFLRNSFQIIDEEKLK